jgi:hypothetical protein
LSSTIGGLAMKGI